MSGEPVGCPLRITFATALALSSAALAMYLAILNHRFVRAPGWSDQRWFSAVAFAIAAYSTLNVPVTLATTDAAVLIASRLQAFTVPLHSAAWLMYSRGQGGPSRRWELPLVGVLVALGVAALVPGLVYRLPVRRSAFEPLGLAYAIPQTTPLGDFILLLSAVTLAYVAFRCFVAWRHRSRHALVQFLALLVFFAIAANDTLVAVGAYDGPYLVDLGFLLPIGIVGYSLASRFAEDARAHAALRLELQRLVEERTGQLTQVQRALHEAEKLAALGQFSTGVAHEVNNPAAVVSANLRYLDEELRKGVLPPDAHDCIRESLASVARISAIVRQLLDAGRLAANKIPLEPVSLIGCARQAVATARARVPARVALDVRIDERLHVLGQERVAVQILANLVINGAQAIPEERSGHVSVRAERLGEGRLRVVVEDDGVGMPPEVLRRVFEPFFSTKRFGVGTGLGLSVSRGLTLSMGGDLRLESAPGQGTRALLELTEAPSPAAARPALPGPPSEDGRRTLLLVDDDPAVLRALSRLLEPHYQLLQAGSVEEALVQADVGHPDLVLCDVTMPDGGGEALYRALEERSPALARRVVFLTGGADPEAMRSFFARQPQPLLEKPLDLGVLALTAERIAPAGARPGADDET